MCSWRIEAAQEELYSTLYELEGGSGGRGRAGTATPVPFRAKKSRRQAGLLTFTTIPPRERVSSTLQ